MTKVLKIALWVFAGVLLLTAGVGGAALLPSVQRWVLHRAVAGQPGLNLHAERVRVRLHSVELGGVDIATAGATVRVPALAAEVDLWRFWRRGELVVGRLEARGFSVALATTEESANRPSVSVDAAATSPAAGSSADKATRTMATPSAQTTPANVSAAAASGSKTPLPPAFAGVLSPVKLPFPITIGRLELQGAFRFNGPAGAVAPSATMELIGGGLAPGGKFDGALKVAVQNPVSGADVQKLSFDGQLTLEETTDLRIGAVSLAALVAAQAENAPDERRLKIALALSQPQAGGDESVALTIELPRPSGVAARLVSLQARYAPARGLIEGEWQLQGRRAQLADFIRGRELPEFDGVSTGKFSFAPATGDTAAEGTVSLALGTLAGVRSELAAVGAVKLDATFAASRKGDTISLAKLETTLAQGRAEVLRVKSLQPAAYDRKTSTVAFAHPQSDLIQVEIAGLPVAWLRPFLDGVELEGREIVGSFAVGAAADGSRVALRALQPLTFDGLTLRQAGRTWLDRAKITFTPRVEHSAEGTIVLVPDLVVAMAGGDKFEVHCDVRATGDGAARTVGFAATLRAQVPTLLKAVLPPNAGGLQGDVKFAGALRGKELALQTVSLLAKRGNGLALAEVETRQPFTLFLDSLTVRPEKTGEPLARVALSGLPLEWLRPWLPGWQVSGELASGEALVQTDGTANLAVETLRPLAFRDLRLAQEGKLFAEDVEGEIALKARGSRERVQVDSVSMDLRRGAESFVRLAGSFDFFNGADARIEGRGRFEADAVRVLALPPLQAFATLAHGRVSGDGDFSWGAKPRAKLNLRGRELVGREGAVAWGDVTLGVELSTAADGSLQFKVPAAVGNAGRRSEFQLNGALRVAEGNSSATAALTADHLYFEDLRAIATLARGVPAEEAATPTKNGVLAVATPAVASPDQQPAWAGFTGRVDVDVKHITADDYEVTGVKTALVIEPQRLALEKLEGRFNDAPATASAELRFKAGDATPYMLRAETDFKGFDIGAFLKAAQGTKEPMLETVLDVQAKLDGRGATLTTLADGTTGRFVLHGGKGVLRIPNKTSKVMGLLGDVASMMGVRDGKTGLFAGGQLVQKLERTEFEQVDAVIERAADLNVQFQTIDFRGNDTRLSGKGTATHVAGKTLLEYPLQLEMSLAGKESTAYLLGKLGKLDSTKDEFGYFPATTRFNVGGTLGKPDWMAMWVRLGLDSFLGK